jgi:AcrR family transcriptional regulator
MLDAAAELFFEQGYAATSIDAIIDRVGGSKRNVYNEFGGKDGLFLALIDRTVGAALGALRIEAPEGPDLKAMLLSFAERLAGLYMSPALIGIYRTAIAESARFPGLVRQFYEDGPSRAAAGLAVELRAAQARGELRDIDPDTAANHFVAMLRDNLHLQVLLGLRPAPGPEETRRTAAAAVDLFLHGVAVDSLGR